MSQRAEERDRRVQQLVRDLQSNLIVSANRSKRLGARTRLKSPASISWTVRSTSNSSSSRKSSSAVKAGARGTAAASCAPSRGVADESAGVPVAMPWALQRTARGHYDGRKARNSKLCRLPATIFGKSTRVSHRSHTISERVRSYSEAGRASSRELAQLLASRSRCSRLRFQLLLSA